MFLLSRADSEGAKKKARMEKLAAWKRQQEKPQEPVFQAQEDLDEAAAKENNAKVW